MSSLSTLDYTLNSFSTALSKFIGAVCERRSTAEREQIRAIARLEDHFSFGIKAYSRAFLAGRYLRRLPFGDAEDLSHLNPYDEQLLLFACRNEDNLSWWNAGTTHELQFFKWECRRWEKFREVRHCCRQVVSGSIVLSSPEMDDLIQYGDHVLRSRTATSDVEMKDKMVSLSRNIAHLYRTDIKQIFDETPSEEINEINPTGLRRRENGRAQDKEHP